MDQRELPPISETYYRHSRPFPGVELIIETFDLQLFITSSGIQCLIAVGMQLVSGAAKRSLLDGLRY